MDGDKKNLSEFVPLAKVTVKRLMANGKDEVAERVATKILESEEYLKVRPNSLSLTKKVVVNLDGKVAASMVKKMSQVFGGGDGEDIPEEVVFEEVEQEKKALPEPEVVVEEKKTERLVDRLLGVVIAEEMRVEGEEKIGETAVHAEASASERGDSGNGKGNRKMGKRKARKG